MNGFSEIGHGILVLISIVSALILFILYHKLFVLPRLNTKLSESGRKQDHGGKVNIIQSPESEISDEVSAVIGLALHIYTKRLSDYEKARLTIARVSRTYSPWSSKIYGLRQNPRR